MAEVKIINADNGKEIKAMVENLLIKGKLGIYSEETTLKSNDREFNTFDNSFIRLAALTNAVIQPISIYWFEHKGHKKPIINSGTPLVSRVEL